MRHHKWIIVGKRRAHLTVCANCRMCRLSKSDASMRRASRPCGSSWADDD